MDHNLPGQCPLLDSDETPSSAMTQIRNPRHRQGFHEGGLLSTAASLKPARVFYQSFKCDGLPKAPRPDLCSAFFLFPIGRPAVFFSRSNFF